MNNIKFVSKFLILMFSAGFTSQAISAEKYTIIQRVELRVKDKKATPAEMNKLCREAPSIKPQIEVINKLKIKDNIKFISNGNVGVCSVEYDIPSKEALCSEVNVYGSSAFSKQPKVDADGFSTEFNGYIRISENGKMINQTDFSSICNGAVKIKI